MASEVTTIRFRDDELLELDRFAEHWNITRTGAVRIAVCRMLGLELPDWTETMEEPVPPVAA